MNKSFEPPNGFTLVELMVVVAIVGLLSAVAVPNFKKYQAKAKIAEAKLQLSALYTAESSFFSDFNMYHNCLAYMGFDPSPERLNRYYTVGFRSPATINLMPYRAAENSGLNSAECPSTNAFLAAPIDGSIPLGRTTLFTAGKGIGSMVANALHLPPTVIGAQDTEANMYYTAGAGGVISAGFISISSNSWLTIDHNKVILNTRNGF